MPVSWNHTDCSYMRMFACATQLRIPWVPCFKVQSCPLCHFHVNTKIAWSKRSQSKRTLVMISEVIFKMRSSCFENQLGALDTKLRTRWLCLCFFPPHNVCFMLWDWSLLCRFLYCNGRTSFIPSLINMLDFILKMLSLGAPSCLRFYSKPVLRFATPAGVPTNLMTGSHDNSLFNVVD